MVLLPPTPEIIFPNLTQSSTSDENEDSEEESFNQTNQSTLASSGSVDFEFIHTLATDLFFEIEAAKQLLLTFHSKTSLLLRR